MPYVAPTNVSTGDVLTASRYNADVVENVSQLYTTIRRMAFQTRGTTSTADNFTVSDTASPGTADIFSSDATWTATASTTYWIEVYFSIVEVGATAGSEVIINLVDGGGTIIYRLGVVGQASVRHPFHIRVPYASTTAGSYSVNVRAFRSASNGTLYAGSPGPVAYLAVYGPDIT